jgi:cysteine desulfurase
MGYPIYLDYNATTPVDPQVLEAMLPYLREHFGNPSSSHAFGRVAAEAVAAAREEVAGLIGAATSEIVFTACATEANNLALLGVARALHGTKRHLVVSAVEHPAVMAPARRLRDEGWDATIIGVDPFGRVDPAAIESALRPDTALVSVMHANNEVGTLQPIAEIAAVAHRNGVLLHTDAAQSLGKIEVDVTALGVDMLTIAGHKFHAPKGVGALYVRTGTPLRNVLDGADQERGLRPGTENVALIVGLGAASRIARAALPGVSERLREQRDRLHSALAERIPGLQLNGHPVHRLPNTLHVSFPGASGRALLEAASATVAASLGAACHSASDAVSGVLGAMNIDGARAAGSVRLSVGRTTSAHDVDTAAEALAEAWRRVAIPSASRSSGRMP